MASKIRKNNHNSYKKDNKYWWIAFIILFLMIAFAISIDVIRNDKYEIYINGELNSGFKDVSPTGLN